MMKLAGSPPMSHQDWADEINVIAEQLVSEFAGLVSPEEVREVVHRIASVYRTAPVQTFVPIFIQRQARRELRLRQGGRTAEKLKH